MPSLTRIIAQNTVIQIAGKAVSMVFGLLTVGVMTRYLGQEGFGQYTTVVAFLQFFGIVVDFGLAVIIIQLISARPAETEKLASNIFTFRLVSAVMLFALAPIVVWLFPYPAVIKWGVAVTAAALLFTSLNQIVISLFQRELRMSKVVVADVVGRAVIFAAAVIAVYFNWSLLAIMAGVSLGNLVNFALTFIWSRSITRIRLAFDWPVWREVFHKSWPIGLSIIFNLVYFKLDTVILSLYRSQAEVGVYGATYKVLEILSTLPYMFMGLILPLLSAAWAEQNRERFVDIMQRTWDVMLIMTLPMVVGGMILARPIMVAVAGPEFVESGPILQILLLATGAIYLSTIFNHAVIALEQQRRMLWGFAAVALISLFGYFMFIPVYSYWAAAGFTVVAEVLIFIISMVVVYRTLHRLVSLASVSRVVAATALMGLALYLLILIQAPFFLMLLLGIVVYLLVLYGVGGITKGFIREIVGR
ncbi:flippase [Candidatus Falkowbacteria bacterium]|nr:flippase [Candidatus Falkowbacteria bacterium]